MTAGDRRPGAVVVGTGFGARIHVPALRQAGFDVVALVGRDIEKTKRRAERASVPNGCASLTEALALPGADLVVVASPPHTHASIAVEAIEAGCHVLVEKPFTLDVGEARALQQMADAAGVVALVGHEFRFASDRMALADQIHAGAIGEPRLATFVWQLPILGDLDAPRPDWWFDRSRGGGWLSASVSHFIDAVRVWLGEIAVVHATLPMVSDRDPATMAEDSASVHFRTESGCDGIIQQTASIWGSPLEVMRVAGTEGDLSVVDGAVRLATREGERDVPLEPLPIEVAPSDSLRDRFTHLELGPAIRQAQVLHRLVSGGDLAGEPRQPATFADGVACMAVMDAIRASAADGGVPVEPAALLAHR